MELSTRIRERREALGMSQTELADKLGYRSKASISEIENGKKDIPRSKLDSFAKALKVSPSYLMGWESDITVNDGRISVIVEKMKKMDDRELKLLEMYMKVLERGE